MKNKHNRYAKKLGDEIAVNQVFSQPEDCFELINKYGTYNIQPTNDSDNKYPKISQGLAAPEYREHDR